MGTSKNKIASRKAWLPGEDDLLRLHYPTTISKDLATAFGCTLPQIYNRASTLGIAKSKAFIAQNALENISKPDHPGRKSQFKPGSISHNKGKKGFCYPGSEKGHFSKGNRPVNYREVGSLRINFEGYLDIKLADGHNQWFLLARYNWFLATGVWTDSNQCIWYKNDDKYDCAFDNLELITRAEHMQRTTIHRYPPEIVSVIHLRGKLNRQIRKHTQQTTSEGATA